MTLQTYLDENEIHYRLARHDLAYTAQELAAAEHVPGRTVIKPVVVRADGQWVMCALPASYKVDLVELASQLLAERVELVTESELRSRFADCECGAEPPIGLLYGMPTLMDESLVRDTHVIFQAGDAHRRWW